MTPTDGTRPAHPLPLVALSILLVSAGCIGLGTDGSQATEPAADPAEARPADGTEAGSGDQGNTSQDPDPGEEDPPSDDANASQAEGSEEPAGSTEEAPEARTVRHTQGKTTITGTTDRVVALEFNHIEHLLAMGIQPVGVADKEGYQTWVGTGVPLAPSVVDVGTRQEPSLEKIAELEPDLILAIEFRHAEIYDRLSKLAPTLVFQAFPENSSEDTHFSRMESIFTRTAKATAHEATGRQVLEDMHAHLDRTRAKLESHEQTGREILTAQVFTHQDTPLMRVFTDNSIPGEIATHLGLENAWTVEREQYGFSTVSMEGLVHVQHADFFYQAQPDDNPVEDDWADNPVWNSYEFVQEDRVYPLGAKAWLFGGPLMVERIADRIADHLVG